MKYSPALLDSIAGTYRLAYTQKHPIAISILDMLANAGIISAPSDEERENYLTSTNHDVSCNCEVPTDRHDADDDGEWKTINGVHIHFGEGGEPDKGPASLVSAVKAEALSKGKTGGGSAEKRKETESSASAASKTEKPKRPPSGTKAQKDHTVTGKSEECQKIYDEMRSKEPQITDDLCEIAADLDCEMFGLDFSVKTGSSVSEKIDRKRKDKKLGPEVTDEQIIRGFADVVRYTTMGKHDDLANKAGEIITRLEKSGYEVPKVENKYLIPDTDYKGIHLDVVSPTGLKFELQVHSEESMAVKEVNHKLYEESRKVDTPPERKAELERQMRANSAALPQPKGIENLKDRG